MAEQGGNWRTIEQGDCLDNLATDAGFFWETVWLHDQNRELRDQRSDAFELYPGDRLFIPDKETGSANGGTESTHRFRLKGVPSEFRVKFEWEGEAIANVSYELTIDGARSTGQTDGSGELRAPIAPSAREAKVVLINPPDGAFDEIMMETSEHLSDEEEEEAEAQADSAEDEEDAEDEAEEEGAASEERRVEFTFNLGGLDPENTISGAQARLTKLGYYADEIDDDLGDQTRSALRLFQADQELDVTGELDDATASKLKELHQS